MSLDETALNEEVIETEQVAQGQVSCSDDSLAKIANIIVETAGCSIKDVTKDAKLEALGVDSLKAITVLFELEEVFDIEIPNEIIPTIITVQDILDKIAEIDNQAA